MDQARRVPNLLTVAFAAIGLLRTAQFFSGGGPERLLGGLGWLLLAGASFFGQIPPRDWETSSPSSRAAAIAGGIGLALLLVGAALEIWA